jgi:hypothetical protein
VLDGRCVGWAETLSRSESCSASTGTRSPHCPIGGAGSSPAVERRAQAQTALPGGIGHASLARWPELAVPAGFTASATAGCKSSARPHWPELSGEVGAACLTPDLR